MQFKTCTNNFAFLFWVLKIKIKKSQTKKLTLSLYNHEKDICEIREGAQGNVIIFVIFDFLNWVLRI